VAVVAGRHCVDEITTKPYQTPVLALEIQWHGGDFKTNPDARIIGEVRVVIRA
jgi:hypothetical protein